jgi:hypothetical protein
MSLSRPTASKFIRKLACAAGVCFGLVSFSAASASAATCEGQTFTQPFATLNDLNYYTLVPGSEFNGPSEGWELSGGANVVNATRPDGSVGGVLDLPPGAVAISPPECVTLLYPTARSWVQNVEGREAVTVAVSYAGTKTATKPKTVGQLSGQGTSWTLSNPFQVQPGIAGKLEDTRQVQFIYTGAKASDVHVFGLYVDPRMS